LIYKEEVRDWLDEPLATNYKSVFDGLENRCQIQILQHSAVKEYKLKIMSKLHTFQHSSEFILESGDSFNSISIAYHTYGTLTSNSKVIWVCHALTANSDVADWWNGLFGKGDLFDREDYFVVCANVLGSCYGTTGPLSEELPEEQRFLHFPLVTTRDMAQAHDLLKSALGIDQIHLLIGSSLGGQQAQEFAYTLKDKLTKLVLIATNAKHSPYGIAFNESQRLTLLADPTFEENRIDGGQKGLKAARSIAMLSYRSYDGYLQTQSETELDKVSDFKASSYQNYQGQKLVNRFNAYSYWFLSKAMDSHNIGRGRLSIEKALNEITADTLVVGITSDLLFPVSEQAFLAEHIPNGKLEVIDSIFGHDGFLVETKTLEKTLINFLNK
jgi:homoserine O-acetyltransferase/O-succinyltransferase